MKRSYLDDRVRVPDQTDLSDNIKSLKTELLYKTKQLSILRNKLVHIETDIYNKLVQNETACPQELSIRHDILKKRITLQEKVTLINQIESEIAHTKTSRLVTLRDRGLHEAAKARRAISGRATDPLLLDLQNEVIGLRQLKDERNQIDHSIIARKKDISKLKKLLHYSATCTPVEANLLDRLQSLGEDEKKTLRKLRDFPNFLRRLASADHDADGVLTAIQMHAEFPGSFSISELQKLSSALGGKLRVLEVFLASKFVLRIH